MVRDLTFKESADLAVPVVMVLAGVLSYQLMTGKMIPLIVQILSISFALTFLMLMIAFWLKYDKTPVAALLGEREP